MILPVVAYGHPVLRKEGKDIDPSFPGLKKLIDDMFETMYASEGVGLAAHQVNQPIRLFIIDAAPYGEQHPEIADFKRVFINARLYEQEGEEWSFNEGCLSFPGIREDIFRKPKIKIRYVDENFEPHDEEFDGLLARVIQHEYDHIDGVLFIDHMSSLRRMVLKGKLTDISKGNVDVHYKMIFPVIKKKKK